LLAALTLSAISASALAGPNPYSDCGIGAALFEKTKWAAVTSNVIWDLGLTAIVSATASPETCSGAQAQTAALILEALPEIEREVAVGGGDTIDMIASNLQCDGSLPTAMGDAYQQVITSASYSGMTRIEKSTVLYDAVQKQSASACAVVL
jgi:hypothetical protein